MRAALLLALLALPAMAQRPDRLTPARMDRRDRLYAADASAFRLLPPSASIPGGECSGQAITGTRGEAVTVTRASSAYCTKGDGTLSLVSSNQPRVSLVSNAPALLVETSATNSGLRSEEFDNVIWTRTGGVTVTANTTVAPNGTTTADTINFGASPTNTAQIFQNIGGLSPSTNYIESVWAVTTSGTMSIRLSRTNTATWTTATIGATETITTTPRRLFLSYTTGAAETNSGLVIGGESKTPFSPSAGSIILWGFQHEAGAVATSYIATTGTSATRAADVVTVPKPSGVSASEGCARFCIAPLWTGSSPGCVNFFAGSTAVADGPAYSCSSGNFSADDGTTSAAIAANWTAGSQVCLRTKWSVAANQLVVENLTAGTSNSATFTGHGSLSGANIRIGSDSSAGSQAKAYLSSFAVGASVGACDR